MKLRGIHDRHSNFIFNFFNNPLNNFIWFLLNFRNQHDGLNRYKLKHDAKNKNRAALQHKNF